MLELYRAIEPYLAALGLTALSVGVIFAALFGAMRWFGESWITSKFSERLEAFKHAQQREIEHLKFQINASMDRAVSRASSMARKTVSWSGLFMTLTPLSTDRIQFRNFNLVPSESIECKF